MIFNKAYNLENRRDFLNYLRVKLFGDNLIENIKPIQIDRKTIFFEESSCFELGEITLDKKVSIFEIKQKSKNDPRITLTRDAFKIMESKGVQNALIVFYSHDSSSWRLSLLTLKKSWGETQTSNPKRYSFLLGEGEKTKTPEKYLNKTVSNFEDLVSRFDVEVVRKEFFNDYLTLYIRLYKAITDDSDFIKLLNSQKIEIVSFTKNLLGKIVFLYFIQKKGWLGVDRDGKYGEDGDKNFMRNMWNDFTSGEKTILEKHGYFYNDYLEWLFFAGLNKDNTDNDDFNEYFNQKVPYLNGGLFKEDYKGWRDNISQISNDIFSNENKDGILDTFDLYNFTIDEDDLYDSDIAIDPEMLGRIFEKMISISPENIDEIVKIYESKKKIEIDKELNKKFGAFYTPREIVHYMTKESIISYLLNNLKGKKEENEEKIRILFDLKEKFLVTKADITEEVFETLANIIEEVDEKLQKVKILDPAIGSGAFPMGILHEISTIRYYIYGTFYKVFGMNSAEFKNDQGKISMYKIKRDIIQNNIYGVDISAGAIDIARLRFWLSLVVDEETPEPLPNFEFKFVCANTLIPLAKEQEQSNLELGGVKEINVETLRKYMMTYYNAQGNKDKEDAKARIEKFLGIGKNLVMDMYNTKSERTKQLETYEPFNSNHSAEFFDPSLMMGNGKFDIVIGNPPYGLLFEGELKEKIKILFPEIEFKIDIYNAFLLITKQILKNNGICFYIIPNTLLDNFYSKNIRSFLLKDNSIKEIRDLNDKIFQNAVVHSMILGFTKDRKENYLIKIGNSKQINGESFNIPSSYFCEQENYNFLVNAYKHRKFIEKFKDKSISLGDVLDIRQTIKTGNDKIYIKEIKEKDNFQPILRGKDIGKYFYSSPDLYVDYGKHLANPINGIIFEQPKILIREAGNSIIATYDDKNFYIMSSLYNGIPKDTNFDLKYILGLLNSKLLLFFMKVLVYNKVEGAFTKARIFHYDLLFIKNISEEKQKPFIEKVDKILEITKESFYDPKNPPKEQLELERELDEMVYELYGLSEEEIKVVEDSLK